MGRDIRLRGAATLLAEATGGFAPLSSGPTQCGQRIWNGQGVDRREKGNAAMNLNDLLRGKDIDPQRVLVLRHRPTEPELNKVLPWFAAEKPDVFNAYQQTQGEKVETAMSAMGGSGYVASFIGHEPRKAVLNAWFTQQLMLLRPPVGDCFRNIFASLPNVSSC